jgi:hypothetical protein
VGWALLRKITDQWTLGGEVFHQTADLINQPATSRNGISSHAGDGFNPGGFYTIDDGHNILFSAGRGLSNVSAANEFSYYVGYQIDF